MPQSLWSTWTNFQPVSPSRPSACSRPSAFSRPSAAPKFDVLSSRAWKPPAPTQATLPFKRFVRHNSQNLEVQPPERLTSIISCFKSEICNFTCKTSQGLHGHKSSVLHKARAELQAKRKTQSSTESLDSGESPEKKAAIATTINLKPLIWVPLIGINPDPKGANLRFGREAAPPES